jgi:hypothetical protein
VANDTLHKLEDQLDALIENKLDYGDVTLNVWFILSADAMRLICLALMVICVVGCLYKALCTSHLRRR